VPRSRASNRGSRAASRGSTNADDQQTQQTQPSRPSNTVGYWHNRDDGGYIIYQSSHTDIIKRALKRPFDVIYANDLMEAIDRAVEDYIAFNEDRDQPGEQITSFTITY
jgi:chitinase